MTTLTINVAADMHEDLAQRAAQRGITIRELVRRGLALDQFFQEQQAAGAEVLIKRGNKVQRILPLP